MRFQCGNCEGKNYWKLSNGQLRCRSCRKDIKPYIVSSIRLTRTEWVKLIDLFLIGANGPTLEELTGRNKDTINKAQRLLRVVMTADVPDVFSGEVEIDETYFGGQKKNKRKSQLKDIPKKNYGWGTTKQPVLGILERNGKVWTKIVPATEAIDLMPIITKKIKVGSQIHSDTWRAYTGLAAKGYVHRTTNHKAKEYVNATSHINGLEGFWGYLKRKLASKGGIRREYMYLFLGEYVWRYNYRKESLKKQRNRLIKLLIGAKT